MAEIGEIKVAGSKCLNREDTPTQYVDGGTPRRGRERCPLISLRQLVESIDILSQLTHVRVQCFQSTQYGPVRALESL